MGEGRAGAVGRWTVTTNAKRRNKSYLSVSVRGRKCEVEWNHRRLKSKKMSLGAVSSE